MNPTKSRWLTQMLLNGTQFMLHYRLQLCYACYKSSEIIYKKNCTGDIKIRPYFVFTFELATYYCIMIREEFNYWGKRPSEVHYLGKRPSGVNYSDNRSPDEIYYIYTTKSRDSEQTSFCARYSEQSLNITEHNWKFWTDSEHYWKFWTDSEHYWKFWTLLKILSRFWTLRNITEHILNRFWTLLKILNRFWTFWTEMVYIILKYFHSDLFVHTCSHLNYYLIKIYIRTLWF